MTAAGILDELREAGSPEKAAHLGRFFKTGPGEYGEGDRFLGVVVPVTRAVAKRHRDTPLSELRILLASPWHEARLCALLILVCRFSARRTPEEERENVPSPQWLPAPPWRARRYRAVCWRDRVQ